MTQRARPSSLAPRPPGLALRVLGNETEWSLLSRGDRVHGRLLKPGRRGRHGVVLLAAPDGRCRSSFVESAFAAWSGRAALIVPDLALCGARSSDKLSALAFDSAHPLAARLRAELEEQTAHDLAAARALVELDADLDPARVTLVAAGLGAQLARGYVATAHGLAGSITSAEREPTLDWLREVAERLGRP